MRSVGTAVYTECHSPVNSLTRHHFTPGNMHITLENFCMIIQRPASLTMLCLLWRIICKAMQPKVSWDLLRHRSGQALGHVVKP
uniref:Uncharacterized protein n=1 Tax=Arundo donax TaxID=35708 RepID=A0A0A9DCX1_ARUDO